MEQSKMIENFSQGLRLFEDQLTQLRNALAANDLSLATFPRTGEAARLELQTRESQLAWVLEMLPQLPDVLKQVAAQSDPAALRRQAAAILQKASTLDGLSLYAITHHHKHGDDVYLNWSERAFDEDSAAEVINATSKYEPELGEGITVAVVAGIGQRMHEICGSDELNASDDAARAIASSLADRPAP